MELNEIKKALYKQNPDATLTVVTKDGIRYESYVVEHTENQASKHTYLYFNVPLSDIGDATFEDEMPAKLLIRYIIQ